MNRDNANETDFTPLHEQASHWWAVLHSESVSAADQREFGEWVARSPERVAAFLQTACLMRALKSSDVHWPDDSVEALVRAAKAAPAEVIPLQTKVADAAPASVQSRSRTFLPQLAGVAATLLIAGIAWFYFAGPQTYRTDLGEQRSVLLDDGSLVTLNTSSQIKVMIDKHQRTIQLLSGEALFQVAHETRRPFDVIAGDTTVRAVGTQFNVNRRAADTTVTVVEGKVAVLRQQESHASDELAPVMLVAAERAIITPARVSLPQHVANVSAATAWTQRMLVFERRPLGEVAAEFNRYNRQLIEIDSVALRDQEVTGVFKANDPESFVTFLSNIPGVEVHKSADGASVITREEPRAALR
jgi:transmembrane sensor